MEKVIVGSTGDRVAVMQVEVVINQLLVQNPNLLIERKVIGTEHEYLPLQSMQVMAEKDRALQEMEEALEEGRIDLAVHSLKDLPINLPKGRSIAAYAEREDAREVLLSRKGLDRKEGLCGMVIGTSSLRRRRQLEALYKDVKVKELHGDVLARIRKLEEGEYDAILLAAAGVKRAGFESRISQWFTEEEIVPAPGQGITAILARDGVCEDLLGQINSSESEIEAEAERAYARELSMDCSIPVGAYARIKNNKLYLTGMYYEKKRGRCYKESVIGYKNEAEKLGVFFANYMRRRYRL